jgi:hypothetical protein
LADAARRNEPAVESIPGDAGPEATIPEPQSAQQLSQQLAELRRAAAQAAAGAERQSVDDAIAEMERSEAATKVAELVRAAEAIDRAAAAESELAHAAERAAGDPGQPQPDAAAVKAEQAKVADVVEKIAEGIRNAAPQAAAAVERATPPIVDNEPAEAAEALVQAAAAIRREAVETARNLARGQESQLEAAMRAQEAMADGKQPPSAEEAADQADRLAEFTRATKLADRLAEEVAAQQQSRDAIAEQTAALEKDRASESAKALRKAQEAFAAAQEAAGKTAAALAGQGELANQPLREGLERASQLDAVAAAAKPEPPANRPPRSARVLCLSRRRRPPS